MKRAYCAAVLLLLLWGAVSAQQSEPKTAVEYTARGAERYKKGDLAGAIADHTKAISLDPKHTLAYMLRGSARDDKGDLQGAMSDYDQAIALDSKDEAALSMRASLKVRTKDFAGAIADLDRAIALDPNDVTKFATRAGAYWGKGDNRAAIADYRRAIALGAADAATYKAAAWLIATSPLSTAAECRDAVTYARKAGEAEGWQDPFTMEAMAAASAATGDMKQAVAWQTKAVEAPGYSKKTNGVAEARLNLYKKGQPLKTK